MATEAAPAQQPLGFLSLPPEIRVNILRHLLIHPRVIQAVHHRSDAPSSDPAGRIPMRTPTNLEHTRPGLRLNSLNPKHRFYCSDLPVQILNTCSTVWHEGLSVLWGENSFRIEKIHDIKILKKTLPSLPSPAKATDLIRHLTLDPEWHPNPTRFRELKPLQMLTTIRWDMCLCRLQGRKFSTTQLQPVFSTRYDRHKKAAWRSLLEQHPRAKGRILQFTETVYVSLMPNILFL